jgi:hypothetical protein
MSRLGSRRRSMFMLWLVLVLMIGSAVTPSFASPSKPSSPPPMPRCKPKPCSEESTFQIAATTPSTVFNERLAVQVGSNGRFNSLT